MKVPAPSGPNSNTSRNQCVRRSRTLPIEYRKISETIQQLDKLSSLAYTSGGKGDGFGVHDASGDRYYPLQDLLQQKTLICNNEVAYDICINSLVRAIFSFPQETELQDAPLTIEWVLDEIHSEKRLERNHLLGLLEKRKKDITKLTTQDLNRIKLGFPVEPHGLTPVALPRCAP